MQSFSNHCRNRNKKSLYKHHKAISFIINLSRYIFFFRVFKCLIMVYYNSPLVSTHPQDHNYNNMMSSLQNLDLGCASSSKYSCFSPRPLCFDQSNAVHGTFSFTLFLCYADDFMLCVCVIFDFFRGFYGNCFI